MIASALYRQPVLLDSAAHRGHRVAALDDFSIAAGLHAVFVTATEFPQAALDLPIVFVRRGGADAVGQPQVAPVALLGLTAGENLHVEGRRWTARYVPAFIRRYPFMPATLPGSASHGLLVDGGWAGFSETAGEPLFEADGRAAPALQRAIRFVELFEAETQRTAVFCERLNTLGLLKDMKADAVLPNGQALSVDGFLAIDEEKLNGLPDAVVIELHRNGMLMLAQMHLLSLSNIRHLVDRKAARLRDPQAG